MKALTEQGYVAILKELSKPTSNCCWISTRFAENVDAVIAHKAGLPPDVVGNPAALEQALQATQPQRALVVVVGMQNAGKTTLMWRMREQAQRMQEQVQRKHDKKEPVSMKAYRSTNGLIIGALLCALGPNPPSL